MAKIWPVYEGNEPTRGGPWVDVSLAAATALCELRATDFVSELSATPRFGDTSRDLWYAGFKHVVVEIESLEGTVKWKPGYYRSRLTPKEVFRRLIEQPLVSALGRENVVRVEFGPTIDSEGGGAIQVTAVMRPDAIDKLESGAAFDASIRMRERLQEMRVQRTPIIEYATEAELAEGAGH